MSQSIQNYLPPKKIAIIIGSEVSGVDPSLLKKSSIHLEIPMLGKKESFNVVEAAAMALFRFRFAK
jgi:tRNA G18 (ribose-2'-O)-methylase SpoU